MKRVSRVLVCSMGGIAASATLFVVVTTLQLGGLGSLYMLLALPLIELVFWLVPSAILGWFVPEGGYAGSITIASFVAIFAWAFVFATLAYFLTSRAASPNPAFEEGRRKSAAPLN